MFTALVEVVAKLLGIDTAKEVNALTEVIRLTDDLLLAPVRDLPVKSMREGYEDLFMEVGPGPARWAAGQQRLAFPKRDRVSTRQRVPEEPYRRTQLVDQADATDDMLNRMEQDLESLAQDVANAAWEASTARHALSDGGRSVHRGA